MIPKKSYGQHFLRDTSVIDRIANAVRMDVAFVVEVGPGQGALTSALKERIDSFPVSQQPKLVLLEADRDLLQPLKDEFPDAQIVAGDAAKADLEHLTGSKPWVFVGNLPYNAAAAILMHALTAQHPPIESVIMVQMEQADRMLAKPGEMGLLSAAVQMYAKPERLFNVPPGAFAPPPKVDSSVLHLTKREVDPDAETMIAFAKAGFMHPRKQLHKNLQSAGAADGEVVKEALVALGLPKTARAQELSLEHWKKLSSRM